VSRNALLVSKTQKEYIHINIKYIKKGGEGKKGKGRISGARARCEGIPFLRFTESGSRDRPGDHQHNLIQNIQL